MYVVSACLLGEDCKYNGGNNFNEKVDKFCDTHQFVVVCPEVMAGLTVPRLPIEKKKDGTYVSSAGVDMTKQMEEGARAALFEALNASMKFALDIEGAILKARSPSCGSGKIYDGTFSHKEVDGDGALAKLFKEAGIPVFTEEQIDMID